jgi:hypothetical protein
MGLSGDRRGPGTFFTPSMLFLNFLSSDNPDFLKSTMTLFHRLGCSSFQLHIIYTLFFKLFYSFN